MSRRDWEDDLCAVCNQWMTEHLIHFKLPLDPHAALHDEPNYQRPIRCPNGAWIPWRQALGYETAT